MNSNTNDNNNTSKNNPNSPWPWQAGSSKLNSSASGCLGTTTASGSTGVTIAVPTMPHIIGVVMISANIAIIANIFVIIIVEINIAMSIHAFKNITISVNIIIIEVAATTEIISLACSLLIHSYYHRDV